MQERQERQSVRMDSAGEMAGAAPGMRSIGGYARKLALTQAKAGLLPMPAAKQDVGPLPSGALWMYPFRTGRDRRLASNFSSRLRM